MVAENIIIIPGNIIFIGHGSNINISRSITSINIRIYTKIHICIFYINIHVIGILQSGNLNEVIFPAPPKIQHRINQSRK